MTIIIENHKTKTLYEYYDVPNKVANAIRTVLDECANDSPSIISAQVDMSLLDNNKRKE